MKPEKSYIKSLARNIITTKPTVDNIDRYNMYLSLFDRIRRRYFNIPAYDPRHESPRHESPHLTSRPMKTPARRSMLPTPTASPKVSRSRSRTPMKERLRDYPTDPPKKITPEMGSKSYTSRPRDGTPKPKAGVKKIKSKKPMFMEWKDEIGIEY